MKYITIEFLRRSGAWLTPLQIRLMPLDCDVTPFDNSQSKKKKVSPTSKGMDSYAPMSAYLWARRATAWRAPCKIHC
jgi:hypothetical protein